MNCDTFLCTVIWFGADFYNMVNKLRAAVLLQHEMARVGICCGGLVGLCCQVVVYILKDWSELWQFSPPICQRFLHCVKPVG